MEEVSQEDMKHGDVMINKDGYLLRPKRLPSNLYQFKKELVKQDVFWIQLQVFKMVQI